jgi:predicted amidohydrolase YtcJ
VIATKGLRAVALAWLGLAATASASRIEIIRSRQSGAWSSPSTWEGGAAPGAGARVQVREGHSVLYDRNSDRAIRSIHVAGTLSFATDHDTRLDVGLVKIQRGDDASEDGFDCESHARGAPSDSPRPALVVGTATRPISPEHKALIRLVVFDDMDRETCPALVCCGGRMEFHGAAMARTWVKLGADARVGSLTVLLAESVPGWCTGDRILITAAVRRDRKEGETFRPGDRSTPALTEERTIRAVDGKRLELDRPLTEGHEAAGDLRGEVANLSRNVVIESADPARGRGHTMYHRDSVGSIGYAEFRHLGKEGVKGRYPIHFHLVGESMRGSSVIGASIWDSANRWITIHGTNRLVVRDCVGYRSVGHGFFLEDGTETLNVLDRNLAVQAFQGKPLPHQALPFDENSGAGFWWANSLNTFTRNVAVECDRYGFRYEATPSTQDDLRKRVLLPSGGRELRDIRTLPFVRFEDNEAHSQLYGLNLGEGTGGVGPEAARPFVLRKTRIWDSHWAFRPEVPSVTLDGMAIERCRYGIFQAVGEHHTYGGLTIRRTFLAGSNPSPSTRRVFPLAPDDTPSTTVVTFVGEAAGGKRQVRGTSSDDGVVRRVLVNGCEARFVDSGSSQWEVSISDPPNRVVTANAEDATGNVEVGPHIVRLEAPPAATEQTNEADLILHHGKVITADSNFSIQQALAVKGDRLIGVGTDDEVLKSRGSRTVLVDLGGKTVLPGLIDSHTHPTGACLTEFDHPVPQMDTIGDVLSYVRMRAEALGPGKWIVVRQVFVTRLKEQRYPTRDELDKAAPVNPVLFSTGPDASLNTLAMKLSGIDKDFRPEGPGKVEKDGATGEPSGIIRNLTRYVKVDPPERKPTDADQDRQLAALFKDYNSVGLTAVIDRNADASSVDRYSRLHREGALTVRVGISRGIDNLGPLDDILKEIRLVASHPLTKGGPRLRIVGVKAFLDGGMLTGSAYMREPWGVSRTYAINDPAYRGVLFIPRDRLVPMVREAVASNLQFTAHSVGDGAVDALLDAYEEVNKQTPVALTRPCLTHANFMTREAIARAARLGVVVDVQPAWLYLDAKTLLAQFGDERLRVFQPLRSLFAAGVFVGGGSDHMQKVGSLRSINPYNPFLGMSVAITRRARGGLPVLHPEEAISREQAIRLYTSNNARLLFLEDRIGSLEAGKQADFVIIDRDILTCPAGEIATTSALSTYLDGVRVFERRD